MSSQVRPLAAQFVNTSLAELGFHPKAKIPILSAHGPAFLRSRVACPAAPAPGDLTRTATPTRPRRPPLPPAPPPRNRPRAPARGPSSAPRLPQDGGRAAPAPARPGPARPRNQARAQAPPPPPGEGSGAPRDPGPTPGPRRALDRSPRPKAPHHELERLLLQYRFGPVHSRRDRWGRFPPGPPLRCPAADTQRAEPASSSFPALFPLRLGPRGRGAEGTGSFAHARNLRLAGLVVPERF